MTRTLVVLKQRRHIVLVSFGRNDQDLIVRNLKDGVVTVFGFADVVHRPERRIGTVITPGSSGDVALWEQHEANDGMFLGRLCR